MKSDNPYGAHTFFIPVMGTSFTIDTPVKIAKFGVSSVISLSDDFLIEKMRRYYCESLDLPYKSIGSNGLNSRSERITAYLNLLGSIVNKQVAKMRKEEIKPGSDIERYFEMLPDSPVRSVWLEYKQERDIERKKSLEQKLRSSIVPGKIDVNIMTKVDPEIHRKGDRLAPKYGLAQQAIKGFAESDLNSSVIFSAGLNPGLYSHTATYPDFLPDEHGNLRKRIILKVSDFRSAMIQGKFLAKKGLWISEFRIESGINCGGHAFSDNFTLLGPVLDEFRRKRDELRESLSAYYASALRKIGASTENLPHPTRLTVQGGIGNASENEFLMEFFGVDATGWGTPFLLVPEVVNIDDLHLQRLSDAGENDVYLSGASPLGVPFWNLRSSDSEMHRQKLVRRNDAGSSCPRGYLKFNKEFSQRPVCTASKFYQARKGDAISSGSESIEMKLEEKRKLDAKACLCRDLAGSALKNIGAKLAAKPIICPGPNIANFASIVSLNKMIDHIYGRIHSLTSSDRPHMFIKEMTLYIKSMRENLSAKPKELLHSIMGHYGTFEKQLSEGINYYSEIARNFAEDKKADFFKALDNIAQELSSVRQLMARKTKLAVEGIS